MAGAIKFVADASSLTQAAGEARKSVSSVAVSAEDARKKIVASFDAQIEAAKRSGASQKQLASIANKSAQMFATVTDESARRYINSIERMEEKTRKFNAARMALGVQAPTPKIPGHGERESVSFREHIHGLSVGGNVGESLLGVAEVLALAEVANKMREVVAESFEYGEAMSRAAASTGLSVESLETMHYAAAVTGSDFQTMATAIARMDQVIGKATEGDKTSIAFIEKLGFSAKQLADDPKGAETAFKRFAETLASTESPIRRVELATALLGRAGAEQIPTLIELGENWDTFASKAKAAGVVLDAKTAESLQNTGDRFTDLKEHVKGAGLSFTVALTPALNQMLDVIEGGKSSMDAAAEWGRAMGKILAVLGESAYIAAAGLQLAFGLSEKLIPGQGAHGSADLASVKTLWSQAQQMHDIAFGGPNAPHKAPVPGTGLGDDAADFLDRNHLGGRGRKQLGGFEGVGDLTGAAKAARHAADEARRKADAQAIKDQESAHLAWAAQEDRNKAAEALYWMDLTSISKGGSATYLNALKHAQEAIVGLNRENAKTFSDFQNSYMRDFDASAGLSGDDQKQLGRSGAASAEWIKSLRDSIDLTKDNADEMAEFGIQMALATGQMTKLDAARATAALHSEQYQRGLKDFADKAATISADPTLDAAGKRAALQHNANGRSQFLFQGQMQSRQDQLAINPAYTSPGAGASDAINDFIAASRDAAGAMREIVNNTLNGLNRQIVNGLTGGRTNFGEFAANAGRGLLGAGLKSTEGMALGALGFGKMGTKTNPIYTINAASSGVSSLIPSGKGLSGIFGGLLKSLPFLASGGDFFDGAVVGENGPELLSGSGHVTSNRNLRSMLSGGSSGGTQPLYTIGHIDARGTDPVLVGQYVRSAIVAAHQSSVTQAVKQVHQDAASRPVRR